MKRKQLVEMSTLCESLHPEDGINPRDQRRHELRNQSLSTQNNKRLLKKVRIIIEEFLIGECLDPALEGFLVHSVSPQPDLSRLLVELCSSHNVTNEDVATAMSRLSSLTSFFRSELARTTRRKRTPDLTYVIRTSGGLNE